MINLGDYLGQLMSEVVMARVQADLESVRIADMYASHPLLRHMAVPRVRLPEVQIEVPVVVDAAGVVEDGTPPRGGVSIPAARKQFDAVLQANLRELGVRLRAEDRKALNHALDEETTRLDLPVEVAVNPARIADRLSRTAIRSLTPVLSKERLSGLRERLPDDARRTLVALATPPPRVATTVDTPAVREAGPEDRITRIRLTITEESMELTTIETDEGESMLKLVPE
jgi:hypothetical protein